MTLHYFKQVLIEYHVSEEVWTSVSKAVNVHFERIEAVEKAKREEEKKKREAEELKRKQALAKKKAEEEAEKQR